MKIKKDTYITYHNQEVYVSSVIERTNSAILIYPNKTQRIISLAELENPSPVEYHLSKETKERLRDLPDLIENLLKINDNLELSNQISTILNNLNSVKKDLGLIND